MWLCTQHGFFSVVEKKPGEYHIRARVKGDLENLKAYASALSMPALPEIETWPRADYRYRIRGDAGMMAAVLIALAKNIDYPNFKNRIRERPDQAAKWEGYEHIWLQGVRWQHQAERSEKESTIEGRAEKLVYTSVDDLRSTLKCNEGKMDSNVLVAALNLARETRGKATHTKLLQSAVNKLPERKCRTCGCTEYDCRGCIERTGHQCSWVKWDLCSACVK